MKAVKQLGKMMIAAIIAVVILTLVISIYSLNPLRVKNPQGNTDYVWEPDSLWLNMSEGVSFGRMDSNGFNNTEVVDDPDIILLGSSHIESKNVNQDENTAYYLSESFNGKYSAYNMGISGHTIYKVCQYLPDTLSLYQGHMPKYVIVETTDIDLTQDNVDAVLDRTVETTPVNDKGIVAFLQKNPAFRLFYHQLESGMKDVLLPELKNLVVGRNDENENKVASGDESDTDKKPDYTDSQYDRLMSYLGDLQKQYDTNIIIMFHPFEKLNEDGSISFTNNGKSEEFETSAEKYGITFLDMSERFEAMYNEEHRVPHGFNTGLIASGHLNKYGHKAIADALYDAIIGMEG